MTTRPGGAAGSTRLKAGRREARLVKAGEGARRAAGDDRAGVLIPVGPTRVWIHRVTPGPDQFGE